MRESSLAVVVKRDRSCHELCAVRAVQEFALVAKSVGWKPREGYLFPQVEPTGLAVECPRHVAHPPASHVHGGSSRGAQLLHSFRVGGAVSQTLAGTAFDALMEMVGWKTRRIAQRYVGPQSSGAPTVPHTGVQPGTPIEVETRYAEADSFPLRHGFEDQFAAFK